MFTIPLYGKYGKGQSVMVSECDYESLKDKRMYTIHGGYVMMYDPKIQQPVYLHRWIKGCVTGDGIVIDHIDGDKLNCTRENLSITTHSKNMSNKGKHIMPDRVPDSNYIGVTKTGKKWSAKIRKDTVIHRLGTYDTEEEAALAYNRKAVELHRTYATLNIVNGRVL